MADASLSRDVRAIGEDLSRLVERLQAMGFVFERPDQVLPGVSPDAAEAIARIEAAVGPIPASVKTFWLEIGSVDLCGHHPLWRGCEYPDPLVVFPPTVALYELDEYLAEKEDRDASGCPFTLVIAPDPLHKANVSGGSPYEVAMPAASDDPLLENEAHGVTFMQHLALSLRWGGFPGLEACEAHTWPVGRIAGTDPD